MAVFTLQNGIYNESGNYTEFKIGHGLSSMNISHHLVEVETGNTVKAQVTSINENEISVLVNNQIPDGKYKLMIAK